MFSLHPWHLRLYVPLNLADCLTYTVSLPLCANVLCMYSHLMSICSMCMRFVAAMPNSFLTVVLSAMYVVVLWGHNACVTTFCLLGLRSVLFAMLSLLRYPSCIGIISTYLFPRFITGIHQSSVRTFRRATFYNRWYAALDRVGFLVRRRIRGQCTGTLNPSNYFCPAVLS